MNDDVDDHHQNTAGEMRGTWKVTLFQPSSVPHPPFSVTKCSLRMEWINLLSNSKYLTMVPIPKTKNYSR